MQNLKEPSPCGKCGGVRRPTKSRAVCDPCNRARVLKWQKDFPEKVNERHAVWKRAPIRKNWTRAQAIKLWERYKTTPEEFDVMLRAQKGKCAICARKMKLLVVDHNHTTGKNRALLCKGCNFGIGNFNENPIALRAAAEYLEQHSEPKL